MEYKLKVHLDTSEAMEKLRELKSAAEEATQALTRLDDALVSLKGAHC